MLLSVVLAAICLPSVAAVQGATARADVSASHTTAILASGSALELGLAGKRLMRAESDRKDRPVQNLMAADLLPDGSDLGDIGDDRVPVPADPHEHKTAAGRCITFVEGSLILETGEGKTLFSNTDAAADCWAICDNDGACEQAEYDGSLLTCRIGTNSMATEPPAIGGNSMATELFWQSCYAKNGFGYTLPYIAHTKPGFCNDFQAGYGAGVKWDDDQAKMVAYPAGVTQCHLDTINLENGHSAEQCSHWGPEFTLSKRGCWAKCKKTVGCTQAVYEDKNNSWGCYIGTKVMTQVPGVSRCDDCNNTCYDPYGNFDGLGAAPGNSTAMAIAAATDFEHGSPVAAPIAADATATVDSETIESATNANLTSATNANLTGNSADDGLEDINSDGVDTGAN